MTTQHKPTYEELEAILNVTRQHSLAIIQELLAALRACITYQPPTFYQYGGKAATRVAEINRICDAVIAKVEQQ
jgi:hypothetical protein